MQESPQFQKAHRFDPKPFRLNGNTAPEITESRHSLLAGTGCHSEIRGLRTTSPIIAHLTIHTLNAMAKDVDMSGFEPM